MTGALPALALAASVNVAVICVELTTFTLLKLSDKFVLERLAPATKFVPVSVTGTLLPAPPLAGLSEFNTGTIVVAALTVKVTPLLFCPADVTVTVSAPVAALAAICNVAVICVALTTTTLPTVTPVPLTFTVEPAPKFVPVSVTGTLVPCTPLVGLIEVSVGAPAFTVNVTPLLFSPPDVTVTVSPPVDALAATWNVAVICVALTTTALLTVTPLPLTFTVEPAPKFVPVSVTGTLVPCTPLLGLTEVSVGAPAFTVNVTPLLFSPPDVTVTVSAPVAALAAIWNVAVICVALTTTTLLTVTPLPLTFTVEPAPKFVPVSVTGTLVPCTPLVGLIEVSVGALPMVKVVGVVVPPSVVTVTFWCPGAAVAAMLNVAVTCVALTTTTLLTVMFGCPLITTSLSRFVPTSVTGTAFPGIPVFGVIEVTVGPAGVPATISIAKIPG
jgi:hypothetical protein